MLSISLVSMGFVGWRDTGVIIVGRVFKAVVCSGVCVVGVLVVRIGDDGM